MFKTSQIISKPVVSLYEGQSLGTIKNFVYDKKTSKIKGFFVFDDESEIGEHFIQTSKIYSIGENAIIVKNLDALSSTFFENHSEEDVINKKAMGVSGEDFGNIVDVVFDEKFLVSNFETSNCVSIPSNKLLSVGKDVVFFGEKSINISNFKPKTKISVSNLPEIKVSILNTSASVPIISNNFNEANFVGGKKIEGVFDESFKRNEISFPKKILSNPKSVIGKHANKTIYGLNGEVVVRDMQIITDKIYQKAQKHQKLFELTNSVEN